MATPRTMRAPYSAFKCLRIHPSRRSTRLQHTPLCIATITTSVRNNAEPAYQDGVPADVQAIITEDLFDLAASRNIPLPPTLQPAPNSPARPPRALTSLQRAPPRRPATHNSTPTATLQLRSYSARNLETMADFALRAAYYLNLPARGPVFLPRITERWTVPRSPFVYKKAQENWERITMRRLIQIVDGDGEAVRRWLAFVRRWCWYGVGMKANVWEYEGLEETTKVKAAREIEEGRRQSDWRLFGRRSDLVGKEAVGQYLDSLGFEADKGVKTVRLSKEEKAARQIAEQSEQSQLSEQSANLPPPPPAAPASSSLSSSTPAPFTTTPTNKSNLLETQSLNLIKEADESIKRARTSLAAISTSQNDSAEASGRVVDDDLDDDDDDDEDEDEDEEDEDLEEEEEEEESDSEDEDSEEEDSESEEEDSESEDDDDSEGNESDIDSDSDSRKNSSRIKPAAS